MPPETRRFTVTDAESGLTLLAALRKWLPGTSWSAARKLLAGRHVLVNDALCLDEARRLSSGEAVTLYQAAVASPPSARDVRLVWLDSDVIVVDKPAGMTTLRHAAERSWTRERRLRQPALDDLLPDLAARHEKSQAGPQGRPPGVLSVHRIDRDTSGLVVFARNSEAQQGLIGQFKAHTIERTYLAVAHGRVAAGRIESWLVDDRGDGKRGSATTREEGKRAVTHVRPLEWLGGFTLIECRLETGRTHQIRIHLSEAGHPLYGDTKYGTADAEIATAFPRLALHAASLGFDHPASGRRLRFESPLPPNLLALLARLRQGAPRERPDC